MRKLKILILIFVLMLAFSACTATTFNGSRTGNESQLIMDYEVLNMTESQILELETGDTVEFVIVSEGGKVKMQKEMLVLLKRVMININKYLVVKK